MTKFVRLPPELIKTKELFAPTAPNKRRLSAETTVLQTSSCPKTKLTAVQEFWWALVAVRIVSLNEELHPCGSGILVGAHDMHSIYS